MRIITVSIIVIIGLSVLFVNSKVSGASTNTTNYYKTMRAQ